MLHHDGYWLSPRPSLLIDDLLAWPMIKRGVTYGVKYNINHIILCLTCINLGNTGTSNKELCHVRMCPHVSDTCVRLASILYVFFKIYMCRCVMSCIACVSVHATKE